MPTTVTIRWSSEWQEFRVIPASAIDAKRTVDLDQVYYTEDYADAVGTAQTMAGAGGAIVDRTPSGKRFRIYATINTPAVREWGVGVKDKHDVIHIERAYAAPTWDAALCDAALRHAFADLTRLNGVCP